MFSFLFFSVVLFFCNPQLWCDFDKSIPLKNLTFNSSAVFTDICSYPEVFIHKLPLPGPAWLRQLQTRRRPKGLGKHPEACAPLPLPFLLLLLSAFPSLLVSSAFPLSLSCSLPCLSFLLLPFPHGALPSSSSSSSSFSFPSTHFPLSLCLFLSYSFPPARLTIQMQNVPLSSIQRKQS